MAKSLRNCAESSVWKVEKLHRALGRVSGTGLKVQSYTSEIAEAELSAGTPEGLHSW